MQLAYMTDCSQQQPIQPNRDDISPGMVVLPSEPLVDDPDHYAPLICFAFHTKEESSLPKALQQVLWVIHSAMCLVHKGEKKAFLDLKQRPFQVRFGSSPTEKPIIISTDDQEVSPEIQMQIRVHAMHPEHYHVLVVRSHVAFSLRHAIVHVLTQNGIPETDERRIAINMHAQRVREYLGCSFFDELERSDSIDWLRVPNSFSFHTLFSVMGAVQWIRAHYERLHPNVRVPPLEGFGDLEPERSSYLDASFMAQCMQYEKTLDEILRVSHGGAHDGGGGRAKRPKPNKPRRTSSQPPASPASSQAEPEEDNVLAEKRDAILGMVDLKHPDGWPLDEVLSF